MAPIRQVELHLESPALAGQQVYVDSITLYEALSEPYGAELLLTIEDPHFDGELLLGKDLVFTFDRAGIGLRRLAGIIREVREGAQGADSQREREGSRLRVVVVPALFMLSLRKDTRIFQDMSVTEILEAVLNEALGPYGREIELATTATYPTREYCVQYGETDLAFVQRLMEEEGIWYYFDHEGDTEKLILVDTNESAVDLEAPAGGLVEYIPSDLLVRGSEPVNLVQRRLRTTTTSVVLGEWDWTRATMPFSYEERGADEAGRDRESYEHGWGRSLTLYDYAGTSYGAEDGERQKVLRREAHVRDTITIEGVGRVTGFAPGKKFELSGHPTIGMDGVYLVHRVIHQNTPVGSLAGPSGGGDADNYHNRFECIPIDTPFRPARQTPKPRVPGIQTAVVTGPAGEEIHVDEHGRIKVQFHWDRDGQNDENSSCWIRVEQAWAGAGWGFWYVPRIGMEVVVHFVDGDPDRPLVTGCVYNASNPTPYALPDEKTKSTIKSNSSLGGGGFNEFRFEDKAGSEEIYTHAQKDYNEVVEHDHNTLVHHDQTITVDNDQTQIVGNNQLEMVHGNQVLTVDGNRTVHVKAAFGETIDGTETRLVTGDVTESFDANEERTISGNVTETIDADELRSIGGDQIESISGSHTQTVLGDATETVTGSLSQTVTGGITTTTPASYDITAVGGYNVTSGSTIQWIAPGGVTIVAPGGLFQTDNYFDWQGAKQFEIAVTSVAIFAFVHEGTGIATGLVGFKCETFAQAVTNVGLENKAAATWLKTRATLLQSKALELQMNGWFNWCC